MIKTRFAPSPTGELHIGGARTALFNYLFARGQGGVFVLRLDDTDAERSRRLYEEHIMRDLRWLGLNWDEGPQLGLPVPYRQSERLGLYRQWLAHLKDTCAVYPCFCAEERLEALREQQLAQGLPPRYDGLCRGLSPEDARRRIAAGEKPCWRFAMPDAEVSFDDAVRGRQSFAAGSIGDFVVERSDGTPTYLFASVVDDHLMEITHIIRGDEHIPNTARQQAIFERLGWQAPVFAHVPMILSSDRQKLSKRTGSTPIERYREAGVRPEALAAYLATLSWTSPEGVSPLSLDAAARAFSLDRISSSAPVHDETHLMYWQKQAMRAQGGAAIVQELTREMPELSAWDAEALTALVEDMLEGAPTEPLLKAALAALMKRPLPRQEPWLAELVARLRTVEQWQEPELNSVLRAFMKERSLKGKEFFHPLRLALTGEEQGPSLTLLMWALGRNESLARFGGA